MNQKRNKGFFMSKQFIRTKENFICDVCGHLVTGDGYTNHCPACLTSKHVDNQPGDREAVCCGLMPAVGLEIKGDSYIITHACEKCKHTRKNKSVTTDNFKALMALSKGELTEYITKLKSKKK